MSVRENFRESQLITFSCDPSNFQCKGCGEWGVLVSIIFLGMKKGIPCEAKCFVVADLFPAHSLFPGEEEDGMEIFRKEHCLLHELVNNFLSLYSGG
jgi:hypothetical protein